MIKETYRQRREKQKPGQVAKVMFGVCHKRDSINSPRMPII